MDDDSFSPKNSNRDGAEADSVDAGNEPDSLMGAIGIELEPDSQGEPVLGAALDDTSVGLDETDIDRICENVAESVRMLVWDRIDHILTHAIKEAVEAEIRKLGIP